MRTYKVLASLLAYPEAEAIAAVPEMRQVVAREAVLTAPHLRSLDRLMTELSAGDLIDAQERYVGLFDRSRSLSLHLFEHVHGDSRDRGMAMVDLIELYRKHGLEIGMQELPDYLPLFLEFLSQMAPDEARKLLKDSAHILAAIHARLAKRDSPYAVIFAALLFLADTKVAPMEVTEDDDSPEALDRAWEEAAVSFGPEGFAGAGQGCSRATGMLRRMNLS